MGWARQLFSRGRLYSDLSAEIREHLEEKIEELVAEGMPREEAEAKARREFGNVTLMEERGREVWQWPRLESFFADVRYGLRMLRKSPGFTAVAVLTLALGIGTNTAIFSVVDAVLLRPLPFKDSGRLVDVWANNPSHNEVLQGASYPEFLDWKKQNSVFASMAVYRDSHGDALTGKGDPVRLHTAIVSSDLFDVLGVPPLLGRTFLPEEDVAGKANVAVLSQDLWQTQFQSDHDIVGKSAAISGTAYTIIGVMPRGFQFPILADPIDVWLPLVAYDGPMSTERGAHIYSTIARLRPGVALAQATSQINAIENRLALQYPDTHTPGDGANASAMLSDLVSGSQDALLILFGAVAFVLLIACANVANLILVRSVGRSREIAVRCALGAARVRVVQQLLTESLLLAVLAGALGLLLGYGAVNALVSIGPRDIPRLNAVHLDGRVFLFTLAVSLIVSVLFGLVPALRASRTNISDSLTQRTLTRGGKNQQRVREALIVSEVALSLVMVVAAGLLLRTFYHLEIANKGFDPSHVLTFSADLPSAYDDARTAAFYDQLLPRLSALPGVERASAVFPLPFSGTGITTDFDIEGRTSNPASPTVADLVAAGLDYFQTMRISLQRGREFQEEDGQRGNSVAIINQAFANRYFPNMDPLGKRIKSHARTSGTPAQVSTIIGVVADTKVESLREDPRPIVFVPIPQLPIGALSAVIRTRQDPGAMMAAVREQVRALEPDALLFRDRTLDQYLGTTLDQPRFSALLLAVFASVALLLAIIGLYGAVAYAVSQRTNEIGIRMALGARPTDIVRMVLGEGLILAFVGIGIGVAGAIALTRFLRSLLFEIRPTDPVTYIGVAILLALVALAACYLPARRAMKVDPMVALRYE